MKKIAVIGSINMDMTARSERIPSKGETVFGEDLRYIPGGKGANQAVAAARLGGTVSMFGCVGDDSFGKVLLENLNEQGVRIEFVKKVTGVSSGIAMITVAENDNMIVVISGANSSVTIGYLENIKEEILKHDIILLQNEIPKETIRYAVDFCHKAGKVIIYNPAPAEPLEMNLMEKISYLTPNEHELMITLADSIGMQSVCIDKLLLRYPEKLIVTMGSEGVRAMDAEGVFVVPSIKSQVVDTTGAGDTFNGAFAVALSQGQSFRKAINFANVAAGLSVEKEGAQAGMPYLEEVKKYNF